MKIKGVPLIVLIVCAFAFASVAVALSSSFLQQKNANADKHHGVKQTVAELHHELLGEEIDTPTIPRTPT